jgi:PST family polysaccharide transporter
MSPATLREQVLHGAAYLGVRQLVGMAVSLAGAFLLLRTLGPREYGYYAAAVGFYATFQLLSHLGIGVFLIRREQEPTPTTLHRASTLLGLLGLVGLLLGVATLPLVTWISRLPEAARPTLAMYAALPLAGLAQVPMAVLDRRLDYRRVAWIELSGQVAFLLVAVGVSLLEPTAWAPVVGWWTQQVVVWLGAGYAARYFPRSGWNTAASLDMLRYGLGYSVSTWLYQLRRAVNPLVVGRYLGAEAVAAVSLSFQLVVQLSFVTVSVWRLSTAAFARVQAEPARLLRAVNEGMRLQVPAVAPFLWLFAWFGPGLIDWLLGEEWRLVPEIFPFVAAAFLFNAIFTMQASALFVLRWNLAVGETHFAQLILLTLVGFLAIPRLGLIGWGVAELAAVAGFVLMHRATIGAVGRPRYGPTLLLAATAGLAMFTHQLGPVTLVPVALCSLLARPWRDVQGALGALRSARSGA